MIGVHQRVLLLGGGDLNREAHGALLAAGADVEWIEEPEDDEVRAALEHSRPDSVAIVWREDAPPLRWALFVRHIDEDIPLLVTIFDPMQAKQVEECIPKCRVTSLAEIVAPSLAAACIDEGMVAVEPVDGKVKAFYDRDGEIEERDLEVPPRRRLKTFSTAVLRPYDASAALLFYGLLGLIAVWSVEVFGAVIVVDEAVPDAIYGGTKALATVGPNEAVSKGPGWFKIAISACMVLALVSAACFTGGLINRLVDKRLTGLVGRRAVPRSDHVVVVGLGQVGLRLCTLLRDCGIPVVAVDTEENGENVGLARRMKLPVVIGRGADYALLNRLSLDQARSFAAVTADDLTNIAAAMAARASSDDLRVVLRAGDGDVANETQSLLRIGDVRDVHRSGAAYIAAAAMGSDATGVVVRDEHCHLVLADGSHEPFPLPAAT
jgi:voltage-gated potassium channel Kch